MWKDRAQLMGTVAVGSLAIVGLHRVTSRVPIDWSDPISWLNRSPIEDVLTEARDYYKGKGLITDAEWSTYMEELSLGDGR